MVLEQGYSVVDAAMSLGVSTSLLYNWKEKYQALQQGITLAESERNELKLLCRSNKESRIIKQQSNLFPIALLCRVMV